MPTRFGSTSMQWICIMEDWFRIGWMDLGGNARKVGRGGEEPCIETRSHVCGNVCMIGVIPCFQYSREQARRALTPGLWAEEQALGACLMASNHT